ncbi:MAG: iron ABC transporter permease, partial [Pseudomonadota bacterium]
MRHHRSAAKPTLTPGVSRKTWVILAATLLTGITLSLMVGASGFGLPGDATARVLIFYEIRLPRTALAVLIGAALATSGAALQGYLRNPLAEPGLIGITGGAALGAVLAIQLGLASTFALALPFGGLTGAAVAVVVVMTLAGTRAGALTLILAGIAVSTVAAALTALVLNLSANPFAAVEMVFWMMGSLANRSTTHVWLAGPPI